MGFFSTIKAATSTPAKQSTKVTSWFTKAANTITNAVKTTAAKVVKGVASVIASAQEAAKKKAAAEAAAKKQNTNSNNNSGKSSGGSSGGGGGSSGGGGGSSGSGSKANDLISWGHSRFFVTPTWVRSFTNLQISSSTQTEDEESGGTKYDKKKNDGGYEMKLTAILDKRLGETDVRAEAMRLAEDARTGAKDYVYNHGSKLFTPMMMGTGATIKNIVAAPNGTWISCEVELTLKQCSKGSGSGGSDDGGGGGGGGGGSGYKFSVTVYYSGSSGAVSSVTGYSNVSKEDARKKAWAKVPSNAQWASETKSQASNQTTGRKDTVKKAATQTTTDAKNASTYLQKKFDSIKPSTGGGTIKKITPATKPVMLLK